MVLPPDRPWPAPPTTCADPVRRFVAPRLRPGQFASPHAPPRAQPQDSTEVTAPVLQGPARGTPPPAPARGHRAVPAPRRPRPGCEGDGSAALHPRRDL